MSLRTEDTRHVSKLSLSQTLSRWKNRSRESLNFEEPPNEPIADRNLGRRKSSISSFTSFMSSNSSASERSLKTMGRAKTVNEEVTRPKSRSKEQPQKTTETRRVYSGNPTYSSLIDISEEKKPKSISTLTPTNKTDLTPPSKPISSRRLSLAVVSTSPSLRNTRPASMSLSPILPERSAKRASVLQVAPFFQRPTARLEPEEEESSASSGSDDLFSDIEEQYVDPTINLDEYDEDEAEIFCKTPLKHKVVCITCGHKFDTIDECSAHREAHLHSITRRPHTKRPASIAVDAQNERRASLVQTKTKRFTSSRHSWSVREMGRV